MGLFSRVSLFTRTEKVESNTHVEAQASADVAVDLLSTVSSSVSAHVMADVDVAAMTDLETESHSTAEADVEAAACVTSQTAVAVDANLDVMVDAGLVAVADLAVWTQAEVAAHVDAAVVVAEEMHHDAQSSEQVHLMTDGFVVAAASLDDCNEHNEHTTENVGVDAIVVADTSASLAGLVDVDGELDLLLGVESQLSLDDMACEDEHDDATMFDESTSIIAVASLDAALAAISNCEDSFSQLES